MNEKNSHTLKELYKQDIGNVSIGMPQYLRYLITRSPCMGQEGRT